MTDKAQSYTETELHKFGVIIASSLNLREARNEGGRRYVPKRYATLWGTFTAIGVARLVMRLGHALNERVADGCPLLTEPKE